MKINRLKSGEPVAIKVADMCLFTSASSGFMFCTNFSDSLLMLKFVRWTKLFEICSGSLEYGSVANLAASCYRPSHIRNLLLR